MYKCKLQIITEIISGDTIEQNIVMRRILDPLQKEITTQDQDQEDPLEQLRE